MYYILKSCTPYEVFVRIFVFWYKQVIDYFSLPVGNPVAEGRRALIRNMWSERIKGAKQNIEVNVLWDHSIGCRQLPSY